MKIGELNVGDLVTWSDPNADYPNDMGIVLEVEPCTAVDDRVAEAVIYWQNEEVKPNSFDGSELDDWFGRGLCKVVNENR